MHAMECALVEDSWCIPGSPTHADAFPGYACAQKSISKDESRFIPGSQFELSLLVQWTTSQGVVTGTRLPLAAIRGIDDLRTLFHRLICGAFPHNPPDYLLGNEYYKYAPAEDFVKLPGDAVNTHFSLIAAINGLDVIIAERDLGAEPDPERRMFVTVAEFESEPIVLSDGTEAVLCLVAYPTISIRKVFLDEMMFHLLSATSSPAGSTCSSVTFA